MREKEEEECIRRHRSCVLNEMMGLRGILCWKMPLREVKRRMLPPMRKYVHNENIHSTWEREIGARKNRAATTTAIPSHFQHYNIFTSNFSSSNPFKHPLWVKDSFCYLYHLYKMPFGAPPTYIHLRPRLSLCRTVEQSSNSIGDDDATKNVQHIFVDLRSPPSSPDTRFHPFRFSI